MKKRIFSFVTAMVMLLTILPVSVFAEAEIASGICGENATWVLYNSGELVISGTGDMHGWSGFFDDFAPWYSYGDMILSVTISDGISEIGAYAFYRCSELTSIVIPESVTAINSGAFYGCDSLENITLHDKIMFIHSGFYDTAYYQNEDNWEDGVLYIGKHLIDVKDDVTSCKIKEGSLTIATDAFLGAEDLSEIYIPDSVMNICAYEVNQFCNTAFFTNDANWDEYGMLYIGKHLVAFSERLRDNINEDIKIRDDTLTIAGCAFRCENSIDNITIPDGVVTIGHEAFYLSESVTTISLPDSVTYIGNSAFSYCTNLENITLPGNLTYIGDSAFSGCSGLKNNISIPEGVTKIEDCAFSGCSGLTSVAIHESVTDIEKYAFFDCKSLQFISVDENNPNYLNDESGVLFNKEKNKLILYPCGNNTEYNIPEGVIEIEDGAFSGCSGLTSVTIPEDVITIGEYAFYGCSGLTSISIPEGVTEIEDGAFSGCSGLTSVTIPEDVITIGEYAFHGCSGLTSISIPEGVTEIGQSAFFGCIGLTSISIPKGVTEIGEFAFYGCNGLTSISIPEGVTEIARYTFDGCSNLTSVSIPEGITKIGGYAFFNCTSLTKIYIPTSVETIEEDAFCCSVTDSRFHDFYITDIFYGGNSNDWNGIKIYNHLKFFDDSNVHYNCTNTDTHYTPEVIEPTCTEQGYTLYKCSCGYSYKDDYVDATGHSDKIFDGICDNCDRFRYYIMNANSSLSVDIKAGHTSLVAFVPETDGEYRFYSTSVSDTFCYLYDSEMKELARNDDCDTDENFSLSYNFIAGELYYFGCEFVNSEKSGSFWVNLEGLVFEETTTGETTTTETTTEEVTTEESTTAETTTEEITTEESTAAETTTEEITTEESTTAETTTEEITTEEFTTAETITEEITTEESTTAEITTEEVTTEESTTAETTTEEVISEESTIAETTTKEVTTEESTTAETTTEEILTQETTTVENVTEKIESSTEIITDESDSENFSEETTGEIINTSNITFDDEKNIATIKDNTSVADVINNFASASVTILNSDGKKIFADTLVGTGCVIVINNTINYNVVIMGDINGDSKITAADARLALRASAQLKILDGAFLEAANINGDDRITAFDARKILRKSAQLDNF